MPTIITGRAHSDRRALFFDKVRAAARSGSDVLVIVPDQYSFAMDAELYECLGVRLFNAIATDGISSISEKLCREHGGLAGENADDRARLIAMYRAQAGLSADNACLLRYYRRSLLKPSFVTRCIQLLSGLSHSGISPETLRAAAERFNGGAGTVRLMDIAFVYEAYNKELADMGLTDVSSIMSRAAALARENGSFKGKRVFFEGFTSFSRDELLLVKSAVGSAEETVFSMIFDEVTDGIDPFSETRRTISRIEELSAEVNKSVSFVRAKGCVQETPLAAVNNELFAYKPQKISSEGLVKVAAATDIYEECDYIGAEIVRLARDEGFKLSEIAVICGSLEDSSRILAAACERCGIPYFIDRPKNALNSIPAKYLTSILDAAVTKKYRTDRLMRIIKSPLSVFRDSDDFDEYDVSALEEHCRYWEIDGDRWTESFDDGTPRGQTFEEYRRRIIEPFDEFRSACLKDGATVGEMCLALVDLLNRLKMSDRVYSKVQVSAGNDTELEISRSLRQVWLGMVDSICSVNAHMKEKRLTLREFCELLRLMISAISISSPPQKAECLLIGDAERTRLPEIRALFIMQANDGIFPRDVRRSELLTDTDIAALEELDADITLSPKNALNKERMSTYMAVTAPTQRLYVSYTESDRTGAKTAPSQLPALLRKLFEDEILLRPGELPPEFFCTSLRTAFYKYLEHRRDNTVSAANIYASLAGSEEYLSRIENAARQAAAGSSEHIPPELARSLYFRNGIKLSATGITDYYKCPFYYFCRNGLKLPTPTSSRLDPVNIGNIAHRCLEAIMSVEKDGRKVYDEHFHLSADDELKERVDKLTDRIITELLGGEGKHGLTFKAGVKRLKDSIFRIVRYFRDEIKGSEFRPAAFEYPLGGESGGCTLEGLNVNGEDVTLIGNADRIDISGTDDLDVKKKRWLRVVDYKTGSQKFKINEIYHGLGLQMVIYLLALDSGRARFGGDIHKAGVMYSHIRSVEPDLSAAETESLESGGELEERIRLECAKSYKPDGMMLDDEVRAESNMSDNGVYTIFTYKEKPGADGSPERKKGTAEPVSEERLWAMEQFALEKVGQMAKELSEGNVSPDPIRTGKSSTSCTYCGYKDICRRADPKEMRMVCPEDKELLNKELERILSSINKQ
ncbi:MAG: PD-(D/E)XK nuclease family protein [Ruminococcus sp.]|nr:PD-(D/E)XK nuclease family protein [Ruminococcus sp.]